MKPMTPRTLEWIDQAPTTFTRNRRINASADDIWAVIADHAAWPTWFPGLRKVVPGENVEGIGGTRTVHVTGVAIEERFLAWKPGAHFAFTGTGSTRPTLKSLVENVQLTPESDSATMVSYSVALEPSGLLGAAVAPIMKQAVPKGLAGLARKVEGAD